ncbi:MAG TPA: GGDEF domain-containing protein [Candidatus Acidoferrales bacterium]|nr:GGDEF domain-containing protein [Candidatus Acidoferrales bacterium]
MPAETALVIVAIALGINVLLMIALLAPTVRERFRGAARLDGGGDAPAAEPMDAALIDGLIGQTVAAGPPPYDRVFRIVSWTFLMAVALIASASGLWPDVLPRIVAWIALAGGIILVVHEVLPGRIPAALRGFVQAVAALVFGAVLIVLTGGFASPFAFTFPLIVGGASLVIGPGPTLVLATAAAIGYVGAAYAGSGVPTTVETVGLAVNLTGLFLLAGIGSVVGREQRRSRDAALRLSAIDTLTGLYNRTFFFVALEREIARSERSGRGFCLIMLDLDELKAINDRHGHHAGDAVLRTVADTVKSGIRRIDVAARYGGDEFVALLPETDPTGGWVLAEKIRLGVADQGVAGIDMRPTVSVGVVSYPTDGRSADALMLSADRAMYVSKRGGKNRVARASGEPTMVSIEPERGRGSTGRAV